MIVLMIDRSALEVMLCCIGVAGQQVTTEETFKEVPNTIPVKDVYLWAHRVKKVHNRDVCTLVSKSIMSSKFSNLARQILVGRNFSIFTFTTGGRESWGFHMNLLLK